MNFFSKYLWIALTAARSNMAYIGEVSSRFIFLGVILYIFMRLWQVTYHETSASQLGGLTLTQMMWYLTITEAISLSATKVAQEVDEDVRNGTLAVQLTKPISYVLYRLATSLGERTIIFSMNLLIGAIIANTMVGSTPLSLAGLLLLACTLPLAFLLDFLGNFIIGLAAFWLEDTSGLSLIYSRITWILGGLLIPLELFPYWLQPLVKALPFASMIYGPAKIFVAPDINNFVEIISRQIMASLAFSICLIILYRIALRRVFANGG